MNRIFIGLLLVVFFLGNLSFADWPQWRGPNRNGTVDDSVKLPALGSESTAVEQWVSDEIPSDHYGGHGSLAISDGKVIVAIVWHRDEPTEKRQFSSKVLSDLGYRSTKSLDPAVVEKMETQRINMNRRLRGKALDEFAEKWVEDNLDEKTQLSLGSWVASRFKKGAMATPMDVLEEINAKRAHIFANQTEIESWVADRDWTDPIKKEVLSKVPDTEKLANDVILALDSNNGKELWRFEVPGKPSGRGSSSTPAVVEGKVYAALSSHLYCVDAENGKEIWKTPLIKKGPASSPLVAFGKVFLQQGRLTAFDAKTGELAWENKDVTTTNSSANIWKNVVICNSSKNLVGVDEETGKTLWKVDGGGDATPVISNNYLVVPSKMDGNNLIGYELSDSGPEKLWSKGFIARRYGSSPIIYQDHVYHLGSARHWCIDIKTGKVAWERTIQSQISSPILADGKLLVYENRGGLLSMIEATPEDYHVIGKTKVGALYCASPAIVGRDLFFRTSKNVKCLRLQ